MAKLSNVMKFRLEWKCQYLKEKKGKVALVLLSEMALLTTFQHKYTHMGSSYMCICMLNVFVETYFTS